MGLKARIRPRQHQLRVWSLKAALREQRLAELSDRLTGIVPNIRDQYSSYPLDSPLLTTSVRAMHAFQVSLAERAIQIAETRRSTRLTVLDVGDSTGTHMAYLRELHPRIEPVSINLDPQAVARIRSKGGKAILARAEELPPGLDPDVVVCFETLEHLPNPIEFLTGVSRIGTVLCLTVPYQRSSRVGLRHIRNQRSERVTPETVHILELSPPDWRLLFQHSGWRVVHEDVFWQFPRRHPLAPLLRLLWRRLDFEGFYGAVLVPDPKYRDLYGFEPND